MKLSRFLIYASVVIVLAGGAIWYIVDDYYDKQQSQGTTTAEIVMYKNEGCQCCAKWADYMRARGFAVETVKAQDLYAVKSEQGIPSDMGACHTALVNGYVVEGHVPAEDVKRMLREQPDAAGLVVPGMPASSPGMNTAFNEPYKVFLLKEDGSTKVYAQH